MVPVLLLAAALDLSKAVIVAPDSKATTMLVEEVAKRTQIRWPVVHVLPAGKPAVVIARGKGPAEGYSIRVRQQTVAVTGNDARGVLFGVGRLLRELRMQKGSISLAGDLDVTSAPQASATRPSARLPAQDQLLRRLVAAHLGAVHPRPGGVRHQRGGADSSALRRRCKMLQVQTTAEAVAKSRSNIPPLRGSSAPAFYFLA